MCLKHLALMADNCSAGFPTLTFPSLPAIALPSPLRLIAGDVPDRSDNGLPSLGEAFLNGERVRMRGP